MKDGKSNVEILEDSEEVITLFDNDGTAVDFYQIACVEHEDEFYAIMQPAEEIEGLDEDDAMVFHIMEEDEENDLFIPVEDDELINIIFSQFYKAVEDEIENEKN